MSDLTTRLRAGECESLDEADPLMREAADRIEALEADTDQLIRGELLQTLVIALSRVPQGATEPSDTDWEYGAVYGPQGYSPNIGPSLADALAIIEAWKGVGQIVRRRPEREPGDWEQYDAEEGNRG